MSVTDPALQIPPVVDPPTPPPAPPAPPADEVLGEAGKRALEAERAAHKAERTARLALEARLADLEKAQMTDSEKAIAAAREEGKKEALAAVNSRLMASEVRVAAAGKLANPELAAKLLDLSTFAVDESGNVDGKAITSAIDVLLAENPYLAAVPSRPGVPGSGDGGPKPGSSPQGQLTQADLTRLRREGRDDEIAKAFREGRLKDLQGA